MDEVRCIGQDPELVAATVAQVRRLNDEAVQRLKRERVALDANVATTPRKSGGMPRGRRRRVCSRIGWLRH